MIISAGDSFVGKCGNGYFFTTIFVLDQIIKAINSFLNSEGGTVIVGVDPNKKIIGLLKDFSCLEKNRRNWDEWQRQLVNSIDAHLGLHAFDKIKIFPSKQTGRVVSIIMVRKALRGAYMRYRDRNGIEKVEFYIRAGNTKRGLDPEAATDYCRDHWKYINSNGTSFSLH